MAGKGKDAQQQVPGMPTALMGQPTAGNPMQYQQMSPFMPGQDSMLAKQLSMGGYGRPNALMAAFKQFYQPINVPIMRAPVTKKDDDKKGGGKDTGKTPPTTPGMPVQGTRAWYDHYGK